MAVSDSQRAVAFSRQLQQVHEELRNQLTSMRGLDGSQQPKADLPEHCLAFCLALTQHHAGEDDGLFTELLKARPDLEPAISKLTEDHAAIAAILRQARALALQARSTPADSLAGLQRQLDGLAAIAESHFRYEERAISAALDHGVADTGWSRAVFRPAPIR